MWQSKTYNAQQASFRFYITVLAALIFLNQRDGDLPGRAS
jgi:predicted small integral membrane protein